MLPVTRRRLLAAMALSPLLWQQTLRAETVDTHRIVALEWLPLELMMTLGVVPMAAAELFNYRDWVGGLELPASVIDVGLRTEPNLELLTQLKPSLILYSSGYGPSPERLSRIAPVRASRSTAETASRSARRAARSCSWRSVSIKCRRRRRIWRCSIALWPICACDWRRACRNHCC